MEGDLLVVSLENTSNIFLSPTHILGLTPIRMPTEPVRL